MKINRRHFLATLISMPLALSISSFPAESEPQWEKQWYPVKDGQEDKLFIRFGEEGGLRWRQWGNGYDVKVKFKASYITKGNSPGSFNMVQELVSLEPKSVSPDNKKYVVMGEIVDIKISYE